MAMPALLMRTSSVSTSSTARWICEPLVTSSVPAYTFFAPRRSASSRRARPIPRLAPVIKTDLFEIFMTFSFVDSPFEFRTAKTQAENPFPLLHLVGLRKMHISTYLFVVSLAIPARPTRRSWPVGLLLLELGVTSCPGFFFRDSFTANAVSPPAEVALATISPMLAKQNGHIASPLIRAAKREPLSRLCMDDGQSGAISTSDGGRNPKLGRLLIIQGLCSDLGFRLRRESRKTQPRFWTRNSLTAGSSARPIARS